MARRVIGRDGDSSAAGVTVMVSGAAGGIVGIYLSIPLAAMLRVSWQSICPVQSAWPLRCCPGICFRLEAVVHRGVLETHERLSGKVVLVGFYAARLLLFMEARLGLASRPLGRPHRPGLFLHSRDFSVFHT